MSESLEFNINGLEELLDALLYEGYAYKDFTDISDDEIEAAYALAYNYLQYGKFDKSEKLFQFLCKLDHYQARFFMGLGLSRQMQKKFAEAIDSYGVAGVLGMDDPMPAFRSAECYMLLGDHELAMSGAFSAQQRSKGKEEYEKIYTQATHLLEYLETLDVGTEG